MNKQEFIIGMNVARGRINRGQASCLAIRDFVSERANIRYNKEFRFNDSPWWIHRYIGIRAHETIAPRYLIDLICLRQCLWQQFLDISTESELYLEY